MGNSTAPETRKVTHSKSSATLVIGQKATRIDVFDLRKNVDYRYRAGTNQFLAFVGAACGDYNAVRSFAHELLDVAGLSRRVVRGVAHEHRHVAVGEALFDSFHDGARKAAERVGGNQTNRQAVTPMQALGEIVRLIPEFVGGGDDLFARCLPKMTFPIEGLGD